MARIKFSFFCLLGPLKIFAVVLAEKGDQMEVIMYLFTIKEKEQHCYQGTVIQFIF
jgi:hypothetical protein